MPNFYRHVKSSNKSLALPVTGRGQIRILLIEDDTLTGDGLKVRLTKPGFSAGDFLSNDTDRQALTAAAWNVVARDLTLPEQDGLDILQ